MRRGVSSSLPTTSSPAQRPTYSADCHDPICPALIRPLSYLGLMDSPMGGVDGFVSGHASGHGPLVVLLLAFALGLRHASDPDHLVAVSTLVADTRGRAARAAARLGAAWGLGHAPTLLAFGLPVLLLRSFLPHVVEQSAEALIGVIIVVLAA